ncbi:MAG: alpha/beta hydrolase family esterase [Bacteroidia bacterium]
MKKTILLALLIIGSIATTCGQRLRINFEGLKREFIIYTPKNYSPTGKRLPVVFNFHGGGMSHLEQMYYTQMNKCADQNQFIVVYPLGINKDWNVGFEMSYKDGTNDIGFTRTMIDHLKEKFAIDEKAIYATGLSRGGFFSHRIAAEMSNIFAAVASIGAPIPDSVIYHNKSIAKIAVLQIHGTADEVVKYEGKEKAYMSAKGTYEYWKIQNGLTNNSLEKTISYGGKDTKVMVAEAKDGEVTVKLISIKDGGHTWPGADPFNLGYPLGYTHKKLNANEVIWNFFKQHRKK